MLWLLLLLPVLGVIVWTRLRAHRRGLERGLSGPMAARLTGHISLRRRTGRMLLLLAAGLLLVLGAARPQRGTQYVTATRRGIDVLVALDLSESMLAEDLKPNRLRRARHEIGGIIDRLQGDRVGLVAFAGAAFVQCPLTLDYAAARMFLEFMGPDLIPDPGTALGEALRVATRAFDSEGEGFKALILISDGEDHIGEIEDAAREAQRSGVRVFTVGIGSESGEPIPLRDADGNIEGYKKDREGKVILTRLNDASLRMIAETTGGLYVRAGGTLGLDRVLDEIERMDKKELEGGIRVLYEERYSYFIWPALVLLIAQWGIPLRRRLRRGAFAGGRILLLSASAILLVAGAGQGQAPPVAPPPGAVQGSAPPGAVMPGGAASSATDEEMPLSEEEWTQQLEENQVHRTQHPDDPRPLYNLGNLYHWKGELPEAEEFYQIGAGRAEGELASQVAYNLGNTLHKLNRLTEARDAYVAALRMDPQNEDAKLNLELTQLMIDQLQQAPDSTCQQPSDGQDSPENQEGEQKPDQQDRQDDSEQQSEERQQEQEPGEDEQQPEPQSDDEQSQDSQEQQQPDQDEASTPPPAGEDETAAEPDSSMNATELQLMQLLKGLEAAERELLEQRFQARSRNETVEKDW
jgi:Ca-activated chloride channel family protein